MRTFTSVRVGLSILLWAPVLPVLSIEINAEVNADVNAPQNTEAPLLIDAQQEIGRPHPKDAGYARHQQELLAWNRALARNNTIDSLSLYRYIPTEGETLIRVASRFSMPYSSLSTLNRIARNKEFALGEELLIPAAAGLFIPLNPQSDLEQMLYTNRVAGQGGNFIPIRHKDTSFLFVPGGDFSPLERTTFFGRLFQNPVRTGKISSFFGPRPDPFTGEPSVHYGVDFATARNEKVYAAREGKVQHVGTGDPIYGNFVVLTHDGGFETLYAHMNNVLVREGHPVTTSNIIGTVGSTGHSTGPHVHFEVRHYGRILNPEIYLKKLDQFVYSGDAPAE